MSQFKILRASISEEREEWLKLYRSWPSREPFAHPDFIAPFVGDEDKVITATWLSGEGHVLMPLVIRPTAGGGLDATSPYGYGGAFTWGEVEAEPFWDAFEKWAVAEGLVSLFCRLALSPIATLPFRGENEKVLENVVRDLDSTDEELLASYEHKVRKNINKAIRNGVTIAIDSSPSGIREFTRIYHHTMSRREAGSGYFHPLEFFEKLATNCPDETVFFHALREGEIVSSELVLVGAESTYSFLGGTDSSAFEFRPNDLLKHEVIRWSRDNGKRRFVLGGGYRPDDGIFRFKVAFAPSGIVPFYVGRRIFEVDCYNRLVDQRRSEEPDWNPAPGFFPLYRAPSVSV